MDLNDVTVERLSSDESKIDLIIGLNSSLNRHILDQRHGQECEPSAYLTKLGWVVFGPTGPKLKPAVAPVHHIHPQEDVDEMLRSNWNRDFWEKEVLSTTEDSYEDQLFNEHVRKSTTYHQGQYWVPLPFKDSEFMPNNKELAVRFATSLKRKLEKDPEYKNAYIAQIQKYIDKAYAEPVPMNAHERADGRVWYLTHHAVMHPVKRKLRVVFNPKTRFQGHALNEHLLQGPDMTSNLVGVLLRFRNGYFAMTADVEMFHRVKVPETDRDVLRFLWWPNGDTSQPLCEYRMTCQIFGATSSPSIVNYCLRRTAEDWGDAYEDLVLTTMHRNFYVDNLLKAQDSEEACIDLARGLIALCAKGGFRLNQWTANSKNILTTIPEVDRDKCVALLDLSRDELPTERTLGVYWSMEDDCFTFQINLKNKPLTRRGALSVVSSLYDPLGYVSPVTLGGKLLLQEMCRLDLAWDAEMPENLQGRWRTWIGQLSEVSEFQLRRSFVPTNFGTPATYQLHHFADASQLAYGVVTFLRITNQSGDVACTLVLSRARVAPIKRPSIPRLELTAATVAAQTDAKMRSELDIPLLESVFWTDSTTVLKYIHNQSARYKTFVANRVNIIRELTCVTSWRHVGTSQNPADIASRGMNVHDLLHSTIWTSGPDFLRSPEEAWPVMPDDVQRGDLSGDPETRQEALVCDVTLQEPDFIEQLASKFSSWPRFVRHLARILRFCNNSRKTHKDWRAMITFQEMQRAEDVIFKLLQNREYSSEIKSLAKSDNVKKSSKIVRLRPMLCNQLLRVGGRLENSSLESEERHPVILPKDSHVVRLLVRWTHEANGHCGQNHLMYELRKRFWIIHGNSVVRKIIHDCTTCRTLSARPNTQLMASLPEDRVCANQPPFTHTGSDCFGPFYTKRGRSTVKRWGVLFTCMSSRAVHVEVLESMDTDAYINALRRFVSRRGPVTKMWSDNGSNLVAAERELRESLQRLDKTKIENVMITKGITWHFSPPYASNFGGVWERLIRSIRRALNATCREQIVSDDTLQTLFCEAEAIVNSRPLTRVNDDPDSLQPLSPSDLLTLKGPVSVVTETTRKDMYVKQRWRQVQHLADVFWKRWLKEYVPLLQERQRWTVRRRDVKPGDIVMVLDEKLPRGTWPLGRVIEVSRSSDNRVRSVKVKTAAGVYLRPVNKLCILLESELEN